LALAGPSTELDEAPERPRHAFDRSPVVACGLFCGAMARLID